MDGSQTVNQVPYRRSHIQSAVIAFLKNITQIFLMKDSSQAEDYSRPWAIIRLLPDARRYTVARFFNRQDAVCEAWCEAA